MSAPAFEQTMSPAEVADWVLDQRYGRPQPTRTHLAWALRQHNLVWVEVEAVLGMRTGQGHTLASQHDPDACWHCTHPVTQRLAFGENSLRVS